ncbi:hypothetical protein ACIGEL_19370 [Rossellomorea aquimaris]|uniref:hypothetical protein n=1 Tax=Rossellomorea aquimaris TaxID=189382 RepID=UPI0037C65882
MKKVMSFLMVIGFLFGCGVNVVEHPSLKTDKKPVELAEDEIFPPLGKTTV